MSIVIYFFRELTSEYEKNLISRILITFFIVTLINVSKSDNPRLAPTSDTYQKIDPKISTEDGRGIQWRSNWL